MSNRYEVRDFDENIVADAALLLAQRHRSHRSAIPALRLDYEEPSHAGTLIMDLITQPEASGTAVFDRAGQMVSFVVGTRRSNETWGPNVWVEDAGSAASDPEALREAYAAAAGRWVDEGRRAHFVVTPATHRPMVDAWFSLGFGQQQVHALRDPVDGGFQPSRASGLSVRRPERRDLPALAELDLVLPRHQAGSAVFSPLPIPTLAETLADLEADFDDPRYAVFVAELKGKPVGTAVGCSLDISPGHTAMMRPRSAGFLGFAAVSPDARGLGAGRAVAEAVMAWSRDKGYEWMATDWRSTNLQADRAWRALGFRRSFLRLHRAIV